MSCRRSQESKLGDSGFRDRALDEEAHLSLYREVRNVTVGLYIRCKTVIFTPQCVGVTLIDKASWLL